MTHLRISLNRALKLGYLTQDMIDDYEPALMFTIPRLAIVWYVWICSCYTAKTITQHYLFALYFLIPLNLNLGLKINRSEGVQNVVAS